MIRFLVALVLSGVLGWARCDVATASPVSSSTAAIAYPAPPALEVISEPAPLTESPNLARREYEVGIRGLSSYRLCVENEGRCDNTLGAGLGFSLLSRPTPLLSWGLDVSWAEQDDVWRNQAARITLQDSGLAALLVGRVWSHERGYLDPHVQFGAGFGRYARKGSVELPDLKLEVDSTLWVPVVAATAGIGFRVTTRIRLDLSFRWTHWLLAPHEQCTATVFSVCDKPQWGHFSPQNAVWSLELGATGLFGPLL